MKKLCISTGKTKRFWPLSKKKSVDYRNNIAESSLILKEGLIGVSIRHKLKLTMTAGLDTRMLLAAVSEIPKERFNVFTHINHNTGKGQVDLESASLICKEKGLEHIIIAYGHEEDPKYRMILKDHHDLWHRIDFKMSQAMELGDVLIKGSCAEIARNSFGKIKNKYVSGALLCHLFGIPITYWSEQKVDAWLQEAKLFCEKYDYNIIDLFYWEHRMGCWQAMCQNESDYYFETFTPFNNRKFIENMLCIDENKRIPRNYIAFMDLIKNLDKDCLKYPINPQYNQVGFQIKRILKYKFSKIYVELLKVRINHGST